MKKILITMLSASLILTGCQKKNSAVEDSVANQTKKIEHNLEEAAKNINYKIYARGNESSLAKPATLNLITADKANKDIKLSNGFVVDLKDVVDVFNEYLPNTYSEEEVLEILRKDENFKDYTGVLKLEAFGDLYKIYVKDGNVEKVIENEKVAEVKTKEKSKVKSKGISR